MDHHAQQASGRQGPGSIPISHSQPGSPSQDFFFPCSLSVWRNRKRNVRCWLGATRSSRSHRVTLSQKQRGKPTHLHSFLEMCSLSLRTACSSSQLRQNAIFLSSVCTGANPNEYYSHTSVQTLCSLQRLIKPHVAAYSFCTQMPGEALPAKTPPPCPHLSTHPTFLTKGHRVPRGRGCGGSRGGKREWQGASLGLIFVQNSESREQKAPCVRWGLVNRALKGGESKGFDFDYPAKTHFLLLMTGWCALEITASLVLWPLSLVPSGAASHWKAHLLK